MSITYHIEIEHRYEPKLVRWLTPWREGCWVGGFGSYEQGQQAYNHLEEALYEAAAQCKHQGHGHVTGRWRIVRRAAVIPQLPFIAGRHVDTVTLQGKGFM